MNDSCKKMITLFSGVVIALAMIGYSPTTLADSNILGAEKKPLQSIDIDELIKETQVSFKTQNTHHAALVWWIPLEFWNVSFDKDVTLSDQQKKTMIDALSGISLLAVVQADISTLGSFQYYTKEEIEQNMSISVTAVDGKQQRLEPMQKINPDLEILLSTMKPIFGAAMGNMGTNMSFYVLNDRAPANSRLIDPYQEGVINIQLAMKTNERIASAIELPLNSFFVPRKCPNGKDAHVSWKYCPWTGTKL